jgi:hypothetical protein
MEEDLNERQAEISQICCLTLETKEKNPITSFINMKYNLNARRHQWLEPRKKRWMRKHGRWPYLKITEDILYDIFARLLQQYSTLYQLITWNYKSIKCLRYGRQVVCALFWWEYMTVFCTGSCHFTSYWNILTVINI